MFNLFIKLPYILYIFISIKHVSEYITHYILKIKMFLNILNSCVNVPNLKGVAVFEFVQVFNFIAVFIEF